MSRRWLGAIFAALLGVLIAVVGSSNAGGPSFSPPASSVDPPIAVLPATSGICWQSNVVANRVSSSPVAGEVYWSLHYEEHGFTYSSVNWNATTSNAAAAGTSYLRAPHSITGEPDELLWTSAEVSHAATGVKVGTFSAGAWTAAGAAYSDASDQFQPPLGSSVWVGYERNATATSVSGYSAAQSKPLGVPSDPSGSPYTGFVELATYRDLPATPGGGTLSVRNAASGTVISQVLIPVP